MDPQLPDQFLTFGFVQWTAALINVTAALCVMVAYHTCRRRYPALAQRRHSLLFILVSFVGYTLENVYLGNRGWMLSHVLRSDSNWEQGYNRWWAVTEVIFWSALPTAVSPVLILSWRLVFIQYGHPKISPCKCTYTWVQACQVEAASFTIVWMVRISALIIAPFVVVGCVYASRGVEADEATVRIMDTIAFSFFISTMAVGLLGGVLLFVRRRTLKTHNLDQSKLLMQLFGLHVCTQSFGYLMKYGFVPWDKIWSWYVYASLYTLQVVLVMLYWYVNFRELIWKPVRRGSDPELIARQRRDFKPPKPLLPARDEDSNCTQAIGNQTTVKADGGDDTVKEDCVIAVFAETARDRGIHGGSRKVVSKK